MIHILQVVKKTETIRYWRNPTKSEIIFGYGAIHYLEFDFEECFDEDGFFKQIIKSKYDKLKYYY